MRIIGGDARWAHDCRPGGGQNAPDPGLCARIAVQHHPLDVEDARVLDLFAGTGALSLEALSRGARSAVLVDMDRGGGARPSAKTWKLRVLVKNAA